MKVVPSSKIVVAENLTHGTLISVPPTGRLAVVWEFNPTVQGSALRDPLRAVFLDDFSNVSLQKLRADPTYVVAFDGDLTFDLDLTKAFSGDVSQVALGDIVYSVHANGELLMRLDYPMMSQQPVGVSIDGGGVSAILHPQYCSIVKKWKLKLHTSEQEIAVYQR